jgi:hypothetical protein
MRRSSGLTLIEVALASGLLAMTTLTFASGMTSSFALDAQSRERTWARAAAQKQLEELSALSSHDLQGQYGQPRDFAVGFDVNGDGVLSAGELLIAAPALTESPPRGQAGRVIVDFSYPGLAQVHITVRWRSQQGQPQELDLDSNVSLEH